MADAATQDSMSNPRVDVFVNAGCASRPTRETSDHINWSREQPCHYAPRLRSSSWCQIASMSSFGSSACRRLSAS